MLIAIQGKPGEGKSAIAAQIVAGKSFVSTTNALLSMDLQTVTEKTEYIIIDEIHDGQDMSLIKQLVRSQTITIERLGRTRLVLPTPHFILISQSPLRPF